MARNSARRSAANGSNEPAEKRVVRCAIYTRKSTEEGLQQEFNSLDAQREAAEAFIASQKSEGWQVVADHFDDGGYTAGNMDRPALKRLLAAVEVGSVDCIVVYKVDRLSRSLMDFARIIEVFDRNGVSFVAVTQQFNTTSSLGRLTLNILLSFAQFEREIISERTRDKMSAARRKGKWIGGHPVLGYDIDPKGGRIIVNPEEAEQVRTLFGLYLELGSLLPVLQEAQRRGLLTKRWTTEDGKVRGGQRIAKGTMHGILTNAIYTGMVDHKGCLYPGEHERIIDQNTWDRVHETLRRNNGDNGASIRNKFGALLRGLLFCVPCGTPKRAIAGEAPWTADESLPKNKPDPGASDDALKLAREIRRKQMDAVRSFAEGALSAEQASIKGPGKALLDLQKDALKYSTFVDERGVLQTFTLLAETRANLERELRAKVQVMQKEDLATFLKDAHESYLQRLDWETGLYQKRLQYEADVSTQAIEHLTQVYGFEEQRAGFNRDTRLRVVEATDAQTLHKKLAVEQSKMGIEVDYLERVHEIKLRLFDMETSTMVLVEQQRLENLAYKSDQINLRIGELTQQREDIRQQLSEQTDAAIVASQENSAIRQTQLVRDHNRQIFDSLKHQAEGVFDALLTKSQSIWAAIGNSFKTAMLTAIKEVVTSRIAAMLTQLITGQPMRVESSFSGGLGKVGGVLAALAIGGSYKLRGGGSAAVLADEPMPGEWLSAGRAANAADPIRMALLQRGAVTAPQFETVKAAETWMRETLGVNRPSLGTDLGLAQKVVAGFADTVNRGGVLPNRISIDAKAFPLGAEGALARYSPVPGAIDINPLSPHWQGNTAQNQAGRFTNGWSSTPARNSVFFHETGHYLHDVNTRNSDDFVTKFVRSENGWLYDSWEETAQTVSAYAAKSPKEFVAEVYAGHMDGRTYSRDVESLYRYFSGPETRMSLPPTSGTGAWGPGNQVPLPDMNSPEDWLSSARAVNAADPIRMALLQKMEKQTRAQAEYERIRAADSQGMVDVVTDAAATVAILHPATNLALKAASVFGDPPLKHIQSVLQSFSPLEGGSGLAAGQAVAYIPHGTPVHEKAAALFNKTHAELILQSRKGGLKSARLRAMAAEAREDAEASKAMYSGPRDWDINESTKAASKKLDAMFPWLIGAEKGRVATRVKRPLEDMNPPAWWALLGAPGGSGGFSGSAAMAASIPQGGASWATPGARQVALQSTAARGGLYVDDEGWTHSGPSGAPLGTQLAKGGMSWGNLRAMGANNLAGLKSFLGMSGSISTGAGSATTWAAATTGQKASAMGKSDAAAAAGAMLAMDGLRRGGKLGVAETTGGGALIGFKFGGPIGAAVGAWIGLWAGIARMFVQGATEKTREKIKALYGVDTADKGVLKQIVDMTKSAFGGNIDMAIRSQQIRDLIQLYAMTTGQKPTGMPGNVTPLSLVETGGSLFQAPQYSNGTPLPALGGLPGLDRIGAGTASGGGLVIQLNGPATTALLRGEAVQVTTNNPRLVQSASMVATKSNANRRELTSLQLSPGTLTS